MTSSKREAVLQVICASPGPLSAGEIWERLRNAGVRIGIATIYRILKNETEAGSLAPSEFPGGQTRYCAAGREPHHHFLCTHCDRAFDAPGDAGDLQKIAPPHFTVTSHAIMLFGRCDDCQETR